MLISVPRLCQIPRGAHIHHEGQCESHARNTFWTCSSFPNHQWSHDSQLQFTCSSQLDEKLLLSGTLTHVFLFSDSFLLLRDEHVAWYKLSCPEFINLKLLIVSLKATRVDGFARPFHLLCFVGIELRLACWSVQELLILHSRVKFFVPFTHVDVWCCVICHWHSCAFLRCLQSLSSFIVCLHDYLASFFEAHRSVSHAIICVPDLCLFDFSPERKNITQVRSPFSVHLFRHCTRFHDHWTYQEFLLTAPSSVVVEIFHDQTATVFKSAGSRTREQLRIAAFDTNGGSSNDVLWTLVRENPEKYITPCWSCWTRFRFPPPQWPFSPRHHRFWELEAPCIWMNPGALGLRLSVQLRRTFSVTNLTEDPSKSLAWDPPFGMRFATTLTHNSCSAVTFTAKRSAPLLRTPTCKDHLGCLVLHHQDWSWTRLNVVCKKGQPFAIALLLSSHFSPGRDTCEPLHPEFAPHDLHHVLHGYGQIHVLPPPVVTALAAISMPGLEP